MKRVTSILRVAIFIARRSVSRGNTGVLVLTVAIMGIVYLQLIFVPSLIQGAKDQIALQLRNDLTANITITAPKDTLTIPDPQSVIATANATPGVAAATSTILAGSQVSAAGRTGSWSVVGVDADSFDQTFAIPEQLVEGSWLDPDSTNEIVLGLGIAGADQTDSETYRGSLQTVHVGDEVVVTTPSGDHPFTVKGIYDSGMSQANLRAFVTHDAVAAIAPALAEASSSIYLRTDAIGDEPAVITKLRQTWPDLTYASWQDLSDTIHELTASFDLVGTILGVVSLVVAAIVVFIVTYIDLVSKRRTIGIERAIGIRSSAVVIGYALRAVAFAVLGFVVGAALFLFVASPLVDQHPFQFPMGPVTLSLTSDVLTRDGMILVTVAVLGAVAPAWRTVRMRLLDAIWG
jgi:putative ABC transport system permease protein